MITVIKEDCEVSYLPFHISARTNNKEQFKLDLRNCWDIFVDYLYGLHSFGTHIYSFVLMPNHYHMIAAFPGLNRGYAMCWFQTQIAKEINYRSKRVNHVWGGPYHGSLISSPRYFTYAHRYIYRNPVEAKLCKQPWDYKYSTLPGKLGFQKHEVPLMKPKRHLESYVPKDTAEYMEWLDTDFPEGFGDFYWNSWKRKELKFNTRMMRTFYMEGVDTGF